MSYTPTTWTTGDTITATKLNKIENGIASASPYDAVIRLTHSNDSGADTPANLTPSIVEGTYAQLSAILQNEEVPNIRVEYYHPWGVCGLLTAWIVYVSANNFHMVISGYYPMDNQIETVGDLLWTSSDALTWD